MTVDMLGGVFSDLSLVFKSNFDVVAGVTYSLVVVRPSQRLLGVSGWLSLLTLTHVCTR